MHTYGGLPYYLCVPVLFLMAAYLSTYTAAFCWCISRYLRKPAYALFFIPPLWVALEYLRATILTGFPWELLGYSQFRWSAIIQLSDIAGVFGVSYIILVANITITIGLLYLLQKKWCGHTVHRNTMRCGGGLLVIVITVSVGYGFWRIHTITGQMNQQKSPVVALIQGNVDQSIKWNPAFQLLTTNKYKQLSLSAIPAQPDLIVWPETATPFYLGYDERLTQIVINGVKENGTSFLIGSPSFKQESDKPVFYNSAYLVSPEGDIIDKYDKTHLVPFGEYVPMKKWLPFIKKMVAQVGDFKSGPKGDTLSWGDRKLGVLICYESIFPSLSRALVKNKADILVNITNDAWFGRTSATYQHFSMAVFRSVENRRSLVRAANTGISGYVDPVGRIGQTSPVLSEKVLTASVPMVNFESFYTRFGDIFAQTCLLLCSLFFISGYIRNRTRKPVAP